MTTRTITAIYDSEADARMAREQLMSNGLSDDDVRIVSQNLSSRPDGKDAGYENKGMWESIKDIFVGDNDRPVYYEVVRSGSFLLTAKVDDDLSDQAISVLEQTNAVDLDERTQQWRSEGWSSDSYGTAGTASFRDADLAGNDRLTREGAGGEQSIPVVEER